MAPSPSISDMSKRPGRNLSDLEKKWDELERAAKPASVELQERIEEARKRRLAKLA